MSTGRRAALVIVLEGLSGARSSARMGEQLLDRRQQLQRAERFRQEGARAERGGDVPLGLLLLRRQDDHREPRMLAAELPQNLLAGTPRKPPVENDEIGGGAARALERLAPVVRLDDLVALARQRQQQQLAQILVVV